MLQPGRTGELEVGDSLGRYRLEELIGEGATGLVFRAVDTDGAVVALKVLKLELLEDEVFKRRFEQEARAAGEVKERHLVQIYEAGEFAGRLYLASAFVGGGSLEQRLKERGPFPVEDAVRLAQDLAAGLDALHEKNVLHRDVKASNVVFDRDGSAMLTDFGLAKGRAYTVLTRAGQVMGTLDYLAPELIRGEPASAATDIYALGCTVFECLAGEPPFASESVIQVGLAHLEQQPPHPGAHRSDMSLAFSEAVLRALEKRPEQRPPSASAYASLLEETAARRSFG
jgi:serine/threonine-protein kinase